MTERVENPMAPIGMGPEYKGVGIWLPQLYLETARAGGHVIANRTFTDCLLEGPAVVVPVGGCHFDDCFFGQHGGDPRTLMMVPMGQFQVVGPIPFADCKFVRCKFLGVGFTGDPAFLEQISQVMGGLPQ